MPLDAELHFRTFAAANPVALCFFDRVAPVERVETVEQALSVCTHAQAPLLHLLLHHGVAAALANAIDHFIVGQHRSEGWTPVHHRFAQIGDAVVHQHLLLLHAVVAVPFLSRETEFFALSHIQFGRSLFGKVGREVFDGLCCLAFVAIERIEHFGKGPLRPVVILRVAGAYFAVPVEAETNLVKLFAIAGNILFRRHCRMLPRLNGILFSGQTIGIIAHRIQHVETLLPFVASIDVAGDVAQRMPHMKPSTRGIGKHIQYVELGFRRIHLNVIRLVLGPLFAPFFLDFSKVIIHSDYRVLLFGG